MSAVSAPAMLPGPTYPSSTVGRTQPAQNEGAEAFGSGLASRPDHNCRADLRVGHD